LLLDLKNRIRQAQVKAALAINGELVLLIEASGARFCSSRNNMAGAPKSLTGWPPIYGMSFPI
jgi:hypothetical protein